MREMVLPRFGGSNLREMHDLERPEPGCGEILVRVVARRSIPLTQSCERMVVGPN